MRFTRKRLAVWGGALFIASWFVYLHTMLVPGLTDRAGRFKGSDYVQFYVMGSLAHEGRWSDLYDSNAHLEEGRRRIDSQLQLRAAYPNYGPQVALTFAPFARVPWTWSLRVFLLLTLLAYGTGVWIIWRNCPGLRESGWLVALVAAASPLLFTVLRYGQTSAFTLLLWALALAALARERRFAAGVALGCLAFKPQMALLVGLVMLAAREWRILIGACVGGAGQLGVAWAVAGSDTMARYLNQLWYLARNPALVELYPSEVHSLRGFFQLLIPSPAIANACGLLGFVALVVVGVKVWRMAGPVSLRWAQLLMLTVLASPHLLSYDLLLLTLPLMVFADSCVRHPAHPHRTGIGLLLVLAYFAPFSGQIVARLTGVQISVLVFALLIWRMYAQTTLDDIDQELPGRPVVSFS